MTKDTGVEECKFARRAARFAVFAALVAAPGAAWAQDPATAESEPRIWIGPQLDLLPLGNLHAEAGDTTVDVDTATTVGFGGALDVRVTPYVSLGIAPRLIIGVKGDDDDESRNQLDLRARVTVGSEVAPRVRVHGIGTIGYSMILDAIEIADETKSASGLIAGFGAGMGYRLQPNLQLTGEITYQLGWQGTSFEGVDIEISDRFLTLGVGLLVALD